MEPLSEAHYNAVMEASQYAYMDLDKARSSDMQEKILKARETVIYSQGWAADGEYGWVGNPDGTVKEVLPHFSDLFPADWSLPEIPDEEPNSDSDIASVMPRSWDNVLAENTCLLLKSFCPAFF